MADGMSAGRKLTEVRGIDISATWSPDGKQICFISDRAGQPQLYLMNADGTNQKRLTFQGNYNQEPAWSPKGDLIAFSGRDEQRSFDIYTVNPGHRRDQPDHPGRQGTNEKAKLVAERPPHHLQLDAHREAAAPGWPCRMGRILRGITDVGEGGERSGVGTVPR